jgi:hypothetical protein
VRNYGPADPPMSALVQGAYHNEWADMNHARVHEFDVRRNYIMPSDTRASLGHQLGASVAQRKSETELRSSWKMSKFTKVQPRVTQYMKSSSSGGGPDVEKFS